MSTSHEHQYTFFFIRSRSVVWMRTVPYKICRENQNTRFMFNNFFLKKSCLLWDNVEMTIRCTHIACWIPKPTNILSEYVIIIAFPLQQWLQEHASLLRCMYTDCLVSTYDHFFLLLSWRGVNKKTEYFQNDYLCGVMTNKNYTLAFKQIIPIFLTWLLCQLKVPNTVCTYHLDTPISWYSHLKGCHGDSSNYAPVSSDIMHSVHSNLSHNKWTVVQNSFTRHSNVDVKGSETTGNCLLNLL
jgi:hypothetical protein